MLIAMMHPILVMAAVMRMVTIAASVVVVVVEVVMVLLPLLQVVAADVHSLIEIFPHLQLDVVPVMDVVVVRL